MGFDRRRPIEEHPRARRVHQEARFDGLCREHLYAGRPECREGGTPRPSVEYEDCLHNVYPARTEYCGWGAWRAWPTSSTSMRAASASAPCAVRRSAMPASACIATPARLGSVIVLRLAA